MPTAWTATSLDGDLNSARHGRTRRFTYTGFMSMPGIRTLSRALPFMPRLAAWHALLAVGIPVCLALGIMRDGVPELPALVFVVGAPLATVALLIMWRTGITVDDVTGTMTLWSGPLVPLMKSAIPRRDAVAVRFVKRMMQTPKGTRIEYAILLARRQGGDIGLLAGLIDCDEARRNAEAYAAFLRIDLRDETAAETIVRDWAHLDEPLRERHRRLNTAAPLPAQPPGATAVLHYRGPGTPTVVEIPAAGVRPAQFIPALVPAAIAIAALLICLAAGAALVPVLIFVVPLATVPGLMIGIDVLINATRREVITASTEGVRIETRAFGTRKVREIGADAIEEIVAPTPPQGFTDAADRTAQSIGIQHVSTVVSLRTDTESIGVGLSLPLAEREWLRAVLLHAVSGSENGVTDARPAEPPAAPQLASAPQQTAPPVRLSIPIVAIGIVGALVACYVIWMQLQPATKAGTPRAAGDELVPGPGSGHVAVYGRGVTSRVDGRDLRIEVAEIRVAPLDRTRQVALRDLSVSVHRSVGGRFQLIGHAVHSDASAQSEPGKVHAYAGPRVFHVRDAGLVCTREPCHFRLHVLALPAGVRPGWDVTEMHPVQLK